EPILCGLLEHTTEGSIPKKASLIPTLRDEFAEFLDHVSLAHLRLLALPTCVGLRYGRLYSSIRGLPSVSTSDALIQACAIRLPSGLGVGAYILGRPSTWPLALRSTVPANFYTVRSGLEYSPACHPLRLLGLDLGPASPGADCHGAGTLGLPVAGVLTRLCAYSFRHPHFRSLHPKVSTGASLLPERSPTPCAQCTKAKLRRAA